MKQILFHSKLENFQILHANNRNSQCIEGNCLIKETDVDLKFLVDFPNNAIWSAVRLQRKTFASKQIRDFTHFYYQKKKERAREREREMDVLHSGKNVLSAH